MEERKTQIEKLEKKKRAIQDEVFAEFCARVGIRNIREYEQREMRMHEEHQQRINSFNQELERIQYEIEFLKSEDREGRQTYFFFVF